MQIFYTKKPIMLEFIKKKVKEFFGLLNSIFDLNKILSKFDLILFTRPSKIVNGMKTVDQSRGLILGYLSNVFVSFNLRPKFSKNYNQISTEKINSNNIGIIIQGPVINSNEYNFLKNTLEIYKKIFPNCHIVVSTWTDAKINQNQIKFKKLKIIKSNYPVKNGNFNINYQIKSTAVGIKYLKSKKVDFILKTRTDCRILKPNTVSYLLSLYNTFAKKKGRSRLFALDILTTKFRMFGLSDILLFGKTLDIEKYFKDEYEDAFFKKNKLKKIYNETVISAEILLCIRYLINSKINFKWTLNSWWKILANNFGIIDSKNIDLFWYKHEWQFEQRFLKNYKNLSSRCIEFSEWLSIYNKYDLGWNKINYREKHSIKGKRIVKKSFF